MRKLIISTIALLTLRSSTTSACEICGGGLGSNNSGLLPNFNKTFVGIRYHFNQLYTQLDINSKITPLSNKEKYYTAELWSALNIGEKWRVMGIIPYSSIEKYNYGTSLKSNKNGLGDVNLVDIIIC